MSQCGNATPWVDTLWIILHVEQRVIAGTTQGLNVDRLKTSSRCDGILQNFVPTPILSHCCDRLLQRPHEQTVQPSELPEILIERF